VVLRLAMAEIETNHIHAGADHGFEHVQGAGGRAKGGNDLGGAT